MVTLPLNGAGQGFPSSTWSCTARRQAEQTYPFDFCYITRGVNDAVYILVLKDNLKGYVRLYPTQKADAETTDDALMDLFAAFGIVHDWVSDKGIHLNNELVRLLHQATRASHHFTLAYCPWSNGTV